MHVEYALSAIYLIAALALAVYGLNSLLLTFIYLRVRSRRAQTQAAGPLPSVTVQLPIYNERWVVRRLIDAVANLDYPRHLLQVQVLDDSSDHTAVIAAAVAERWRRQGLDISVIHRQERHGYKAGALANALPQAKGELIAIFDADFLPSRDWLRQVVPHFLGQERLGFVQTRWGHLNGACSAITRAQVLALDGHFIIEQTARQRSGLLMNFNGTAGIWRRRCIEEAGGWLARTLSEDLDLSYRVQLAGWRCLYLPEVVAPAEVPPTVSSFKRQQRRWAMGSIQCLRHLARPLWRSHLRFWQKLEGFIHLSGYLAHPLMIVLLLVSLPLLLLNGGLHYHMAFLGLASLGPPLLYAVAQAVQSPPALRRLLFLPVLVLLGTGVALSNTLAVLKGFYCDGGEFQRTPKFHLVGTGGDWRSKRYSLGFDVATKQPLLYRSVAELVLALYALAAIVTAWRQGSIYAVPFLALYACGFAYVAFESLQEARAGRVQGRMPAAGVWRRHASGDRQPSGMMADH
ncbi:MAG: glycosyltransferase [Anaerolineae bacterium]